MDEQLHLQDLFYKCLFLDPGRWLWPMSLGHESSAVEGELSPEQMLRSLHGIWWLISCSSCSSCVRHG